MADRHIHNGQPKNWLIAEDNEDDFLLLKRAFRKVALDAGVLWVRDGFEARKYLLGEEPFQDRSAFPLPDVVLADLKMPRCNGLELLTWVRGRPEFRALPFIVFTTSNHPSDVSSAYQLGANWYLAKPAGLDELVEMLGRLCEHLRLDWR